jgi:hypothetical protein
MSKLIKIEIKEIGGLKTNTEVELDKDTGEIRLKTVVKFEANIEPDQLSELLKLQQKGIVINACFTSPQYPLPESAHE